jgi:rRNA maturation protein Rpf1
MYRIIFPDGRATTPISAEEIRLRFGRGDIPSGAIVEQQTSIAEFVSTDQPPTERQFSFANELGIVFNPNISRRSLSKLIDEAVEERDRKRFEQMQLVADRESSARLLLIAEMEGEGHLWLHNASTGQMIDELEKRDIAAVLISMLPDDVSLMVEVQEMGSKQRITEELAKELNEMQLTIQKTQHIDNHEVRKVMLSVILGLPEERKPRKNRRLRD